MDEQVVVASWMDGGPNAYGWGASAVTLDGRSDAHFLDALGVSQYYYVCFDIIDSALSPLIARQRAEITAGRHGRVLREAGDFSHAVHMLRCLYRDARTRTSGEGSRALAGYHHEWRLDQLLGGLDEKLQLLARIEKAAEDALSRRAERRIQLILTAITILSLIGLFSQTHDYLASGYDPSQPDWLLQVAASISTVSVLMLSLAIACLALLGYLLLTRRR